MTGNVNWGWRRQVVFDYSRQAYFSAIERDNLSKKKSPKPLAEKGAATAIELYLLIGQALSWWESSEDLILGLFRQLCDGVEPVGVKTFISSPRKIRYAMLETAMEIYPYRFEGSEIQSVKTALRSLDGLASKRNEIAHGHVSQFRQVNDGLVEAEGNYLLPSFNENGPFERDFRYHHTAETLEKFITDVRIHRAIIMDVWMNLTNRNQRKIHDLFNGQSFIQHAQRVARLESHGLDAVEMMRQIIAPMRKLEL